MFEIVRKLMMARELRMEEGEISLMGERVQFVPTQIFVEALKNNFETASASQYESAKQGVYKWFGEVSKRKNLNDEALWQWQVNIIKLAGWGNPEVVVSGTSEDSERISFVVKNSAVAKDYLRSFGKSKEPVCHLIRGGIAGGANARKNRTDMEVVEKKCIAQGDPICEMVLRPRSEFLKLNSPVVKKQLNLKSSLKKQPKASKS